MEVEEYRDKVENLNLLAEAYRMIALGEEPESESEDEQVNDDY
jgi:hypothetical protein